MSKLQSNAVPLKSSSEVIISQNNSEFSNSLQDVVRSGGSINIVGSMTESISSSFNHSLNKSLLVNVKLKNCNLKAILGNAFISKGFLHVIPI